MSRPRVQSLIKLTYWTFSVGSILKIFGIEGGSELFDDEIGKIGRKDTG